MLPYEAIVQGLMRQGVPRDRAERAAAQELSIAAPSLAPTPAPAVITRPAIVWPVRITIPWSALCSDNRKYAVHGTRLVMRDEYRVAKGAVRRKARDVVGEEVEPAAIPLRLVAAVYVPDHRAHDVANFAKCVDDALEGVVYVNDRWLYRVTWERVGVDVDSPRAELTITPIAE